VIVFVMVVVVVVVVVAVVGMMRITIERLPSGDLHYLKSTVEVNHPTLQPVPFPSPPP